MEDVRPSVPDYVRSHYRRIIDVCWVRDPNKRPHIRRVLATLERVQELQSTSRVDRKESNASLASPVITPPGSPSMGRSPSLAQRAF
jgi:hypothetical protein